MSLKYTLNKLNEFGNYLHISTGTAIIVNCLVVYLILKHSTKSMKFYKFFLLATVFFAFLMDFHMSFIFAPFPLWPRIFLCPAGIAKYFGPFWGETVQYAAAHYTLACCGLSIFYGLVYQYLTIVKQNPFLETSKGIAFMSLTYLIYPMPTFILQFPGRDYPTILSYINETDPKIYQFFVAASCDGRITAKLITTIYISVALIQNALVCIVGIILAYKIFKRLTTMKHQMSLATLKISQQFFVVLIIQMTIPLIFIIFPLAIIAVMVVIKVEEINAQIIIYVLTFYSVANALTIIFVIKSYRKKLQQWLKKVFCFWRKSKIVISNNAIENTASSSIPIALNHRHFG